MKWGDLFAALALVMVIEGIVPFLNPQAMRRMLEKVAGINDFTLRLSGLFSMICGVVLLYFVRQ